MMQHRYRSCMAEKKLPTGWSFTVTRENQAASDCFCLRVVPSDDVDRVCSEVSSVVPHRVGHSRVVEHCGKVDFKACT